MAKVRTTLTIDKAVLQAWQKIAVLQRTSLSATVNEWLDDTAEAGEYKAVRVYQQGQNVRDRVAEINAALTVVQEGYEQVIKGKKRAGVPAGVAVRSPAPPSCNTGGKLTKQGGARRG